MLAAFQQIISDTK